MSDRPFQLTTPAGEMQVRSFTCEEGVSKLFRIRALAHADAHIPTVKLLGQTAAFTMALSVLGARSYLGVIASVDELGIDEHGCALYGLELVPSLWAATQTVQARVFENLDPIGIIGQVFAGKVKINPVEPWPEERVRPYCVQYFESDFDFVVRLLEEEGCIYQFENEGKAPVFTIRHFPSSFPHLGAIPFHEVAGEAEERIASWKKTRILSATAVRARDHFFQAASPVLGGTATVPASDVKIAGWEKLEAHWSATIDRYPGQWAHLFEEVGMNGAVTQATDYIDFGRQRAWHDLQQVAGSTSGAEGVSNCDRLAPASVFTLAGHPTLGGEHFVVSVRHKGSQGLDHSSGQLDGFHYENEFTAVPYGEMMMYLPPRSTQKPVIHGCQTAEVVGSVPENEIWTDKYGRVQVRFWWDRGNTRSCWIRVATSWAGSGWGVQHIPRVGQEVVVTFLDGDPDRPLIVGSVYNPHHMPPFDLPDNKTQSGVRTRSTPGGEPGESNEIRFEDAKGKEEIYIHAQNDRTSMVENDSCELIGNDRYDVVSGNFHAITGGEKREEVDADSSLTVTGNSMSSVGGKLGVNAKEIHLKAGKIVIEADAISIRTSEKGREFIHLSKNGGITIESKGEQVWVNCGGAGSPDDGCFTTPAQPENPFDAGED